MVYISQREAKMKVVIYVRVSSKEQAREGWSIPAQMKRVREYCAQKGHEIVKEFTEIETAKRAGRKVFNEMYRFVKESHSVEGIVCHKVDRLCRNFKDYVLIDELGITPLFVEEEFSNNAAGKLTFGMKVLLAKHYIDNLSDEVKKGMTEKAEQGNYPSTAPIGYRNNLITHLIEPDPERSSLVRRLFELYASEKFTLEQLRLKAIELGLKQRKSGKNLSKSRIERLLKNPLYYGVFEWKGKRYVGKHEALISKRLFDKVQRIIEGRRQKGAQKWRFAFSGLITCAKCGCRFTAEIKKGKYIYYRCSGYRGKCGNVYVREEKMSELLGECLKAIEITPGVAKRIMESLKESQAERKNYEAKEQERLQDRLQTLKNRLDSAYEDKLDNLLSEELWRRKSQFWESEILSIRGKLESFEKATFSYYEKGLEILELAKNAHRLYLQQNPLEQRELLTTVASNFSFDGVNVIATYKKPFDILAQNPEISKWRPREDAFRTFLVEIQELCA